MDFSQEQINQLKEDFKYVHFLYCDKMQEYPELNLKNELSKEYFFHGFLRRLKTLKKCIENIYTIYPPDRTQILKDDEKIDLEIYLQSFIVNVFGCVDNLTRILVEEKSIQLSNLNQLHFENEEIKKNLSCNFKQYWGDNLKKWYEEYCKNYRHALGHRIPLYIPHGFDKEKNMKHILPLMKHSYSENSKAVIFHAQVLTDFNTVIELADKVFEELFPSPNTK